MGGERSGGRGSTQRQDVAVQNLFVVNIELSDVCHATRGFYDKKKKKLVVLKRTDDGTCECVEDPIPGSLHFVENVVQSEERPCSPSLIAAADATSGEQLFLAFWALEMFIAELKEQSDNHDKKDLEKEALWCVKNLQVFREGLSEVRVTALSIVCLWFRWSSQ